MSINDTYSQEAVVSLSRRITEAEMRATAASAGLAALIGSDADSTEAERQLWEEMDALLALRRQLWELGF